MRQNTDGPDPTRSDVDQGDAAHRPARLRPLSLDVATAMRDALAIAAAEPAAVREAWAQFRAAAAEAGHVPWITGVTWLGPSRYAVRCTCDRLNTMAPSESAAMRTWRLHVGEAAFDALDSALSFMRGLRMAVPGTDVVAEGVKRAREAGGTPVRPEAGS